MTREEAIKRTRVGLERLKTNLGKSEWGNGIIEAFETLIPELKESEDERIIRTLQEYVKNRNWNLGGPTQDEVLAWLERQKEKTAEIDEIIRKARSEGRQEVIDNPEYYQLIKPEETQEPECDNETETQKAYREGMNAGRKEVFDHPEYYGLQPRRMYDYETGERNPEWSDEDEKVRKWLLEYFYLHRDDLRGASVTSMEVLSFLDNHPGKGKACDVDEFSLTLKNCLSADSELTEEQADTFARAYGEDLYKVALGEMEHGIDKYDLAEYKDSKRERFLVRCKSRDMFFKVGDIRLAYKAYEPSTGYFVYFDESKGSDVKSYDPWKFSKHFEIIENKPEFNPKPGEKFWVRCKTDKKENLWFEKDDERPAYAVDADGIITYIVHIKKDGTGNCVSYQNKEKFLETFEIIENMDELGFNPKPGETFWVRCKTDKSENMFFEKGAERPAYTQRYSSGVMYAVHVNMDGTGNCIFYPGMDKLLETFDILEDKR